MAGPTTRAAGRSSDPGSCDRALRAIRRARYDVRERPFLVIWEVTRACALACRHCRAEAIPSRHPAELTTREGFRLMDQLAALGPPMPLFVLTGGDPFERPDLFELVRYASDLGLPAWVAPSGTSTLTPENLSLLRRAGAVGLSLSLDGSASVIHDSFRGVPGVFRWTLEACRAAVQLGFRLQINTTVSPFNLHDLPQQFLLVRDLGPMTWSVFFLVPTGRGRSLPRFSPRQIEDVLNFLYDLAGFIPLKTTEAPQFRRVVVQRQILEARGEPPERWMRLGRTYARLRSHLAEAAPAIDPTGRRRVRRPPLEINAARGFVFVSHLGAVHASGFLPLAAGSVRRRPLLEIYRESPLFVALRDPDRLKGRCGRCEFRSVCGGSRSRAFATTGDVLAEEPWCAYRPGSFPFLRGGGR